MKRGAPGFSQATMRTPGIEPARTTIMMSWILTLSYQGWLHFDLGYSPNSPRFVPYPYPELFGVTEKSAEVSAQRQIFGKFSLTAGVGYSFLDGPESGGYVYWSGGAAYDFRSLTLACRLCQHLGGG